MIAQINLLECVPAIVSDMPWHVNPQYERVHRVDAGDPVVGEEPTDAIWKNEPLLPARSRSVRRAGNRPREFLTHGDKTVALQDFGGQRLCLRANLRQLYIALRYLTVNEIAPLIMKCLRCRIIVIPRLKQKIDEAQPEALVTRAGGFVYETTALYATDIAPRLHCRMVVICFNTQY